LKKHRHRWCYVAGLVRCACGATRDLSPAESTIVEQFHWRLAAEARKRLAARRSPF